MPKTNGSFKKGDGRKRKPKGAINRTTKEAHELFMFIMNGQVDLIDNALRSIYSDDKEKYVNALSRLWQYYMPRRTDITSDDKPISTMPQIVIKNGD
jgi:hypothetical protein